MKKITLLILIIYVSMECSFSQEVYVADASIPIVDNMCHTKTTKEYIRVGYEVNTNTLTIQDKLKFVNKSITQNIHEYYDQDGPVKDLYCISHENMYPKWYNRAYLIRNNMEGTYSYFSTSDNIYKGGWTGELIQDSPNGYYVDDKNTGEKYLKTDRDPKSTEFLTYAATSRENGFLIYYVFQSPSQATLTAAESVGYQVQYDNNLITISNEEVTLRWDIVNKIYTIQKYKNNILLSTVVTYHKYDATYNQYLMSKVVTATPSNFVNGDCFTHITEVAYTNYTSGCTPVITRSQEDESQTLSSDIAVYPNPTQDVVNIDVSQYESGKLIITNILGDKLLLRSIHKDDAVLQVNVNAWENSTYIVTINSNGIVYSSKFIKQ